MKLWLSKSLILASCLVLGTAASAGSVACSPQDHGDAITDPKQAGEDFEFQGEYFAENKNSGVTIGVQIVALGEGEFEGRFHIGGLPGEGWTREDELLEGKGSLDGKTLTLTQKNGDPGKAVIENGSLFVYDASGSQILELPKVNRKSPTLEAKAPEGAIVLFDGSNADAFENGKLVEEKYLAASNCKSKEKFGDHQLHIEFRTPFMPAARGQARGNSGVYVQGRYEVQVLDSFGLEGKDNECGGIYQLGKPQVNMCFPPLSWQTYDIDFTAAKKDEQGQEIPARITVKHNGVLIHDNVELPRGTAGGLPMADGPESLFLQDHNNPVVFRNIWVVKK